MNRLIKILIFIALPSIAHSQLKFEELSWEEALIESKRTNKLVFLYAYTEWCEPCKEMEEYTFSDLEVSNYFNKTFINLAMDMEDYPGIELSEQFSASAFPTYLFVNEAGEVVHRGCGAMDAADFLELVEEVKTPDQTFSYYEKKYDDGDWTTEFLLSYFELMENSCLDAEKFASNYLKSVPLEKLPEEPNWDIFSLYQWDIYSREFQHLLNNKSIFEETVGQKLVDAKLYDTYLSQYQEIFEAEELHDFGMRSLLHAIENVSFSGADTLELMMKLHYAEYVENWEDYADYSVELVGMTSLDDPEQLSELAWKFYLFVDNKTQLEIASSWAEQAVDKLPEPSIIDTYASLQFKLGNKKKAVELEEKALELAKELYDDVSHYEYQLEKFMKNQE